VGVTDTMGPHAAKTKEDTMHPLITQAIVTDHGREMRTRAALAAQARQVRRTHPALRAGRLRFTLVRVGLLADPKGRRALRAV